MYFKISRSEKAKDGALLLLRVIFAVFLMTHGYDKLSHYSKMMVDFPDPLHVGTRLSLSLTIFTELVCALCVAIGLFTRTACLPIIFLLVIALFVINGARYIMKHELAPLYLVVFIFLFVYGAGRFSIDSFIRKLRKPNQQIINVDSEIGQA